MIEQLELVWSAPHVAAPTTIPPADPRVPESATERLSGQNAIILEALQNGPALNTELERMSGSRRINSRIADVRRYLRLQGWTVATSAVDAAHGVYRYEMVRAIDATSRKGR